MAMMDYAEAISELRSFRAGKKTNCAVPTLHSPPAIPFGSPLNALGLLAPLVLVHGFVRPRHQFLEGFR